MTADELALGELMYSDDYLQLKEAAINLRKYREAQEQRAAQQSDQQHQQLLEQNERFHQERLDLEYAKLENRLEVERINSVGIAARNQNVQDPTGEVNKTADRVLKSEIAQGELEKDYQKLQQDFIDKSRNFNLKLEELKLRKQAQRIREREIQSREFQSIINKN